MRDTLIVTSSNMATDDQTIVNPSASSRSAAIMFLLLQGVSKVCSDLKLLIF